MREFRTPPRLESVDYTACRSYLITFCTKDRAAHFKDPRLAEIACRWLRHFRDQGWYWLYAYAVMPDHVHVAMRVRHRRVHLSRIVGMLRSAILCDGRKVVKGFYWQRGYHERVVRDGDDSQEIVRYVLDNPRRAQIVSAMETYPYAGVVDSWC